MYKIRYLHNVMAETLAVYDFTGIKINHLEKHYFWWNENNSPSANSLVAGWSIVVDGQIVEAQSVPESEDGFLISEDLLFYCPPG